MLADQLPELRIVEIGAVHRRLTVRFRLFAEFRRGIELQIDFRVSA